MVEGLRGSSREIINLIRGWEREGGEGERRKGEAGRGAGGRTKHRVDTANHWQHKHYCIDLVTAHPVSTNSATHKEPTLGLGFIRLIINGHIIIKFQKCMAGLTNLHFQNSTETPYIETSAVCACQHALACSRKYQHVIQSTEPASTQCPAPSFTSTQLPQPLLLPAPAYIKRDDVMKTLNPSC
jgi:hypothetical protein